MKELKFYYRLAIILSTGFILISVWNGFSRSLGSYYYPDEARGEAIVGSTLFAAIVSLILFGLVVALRKKKLFAEILWIGLSPALLMLGWDIVTKNLAERGVISVNWITGYIYVDQSQSFMKIHRMVWITSGIIIAIPFLLNVCRRLMRRKV